MAKKRTATARRVRVNVFLDADQHAALTKLGEATRVPWANYVRDGVDMVLAKHRKQLRG